MPRLLLDPLTAEGIRRGQVGVKSRRRILRAKPLHHGAKNCSRHLAHSIPPCRSPSGEGCDLTLGLRRRELTHWKKRQIDTRRRMETRVTQTMSPEAQRTPQKGRGARMYE